MIRGALRFLVLPAGLTLACTHAPQTPQVSPPTETGILSYHSDRDLVEMLPASVDFMVVDIEEIPGEAVLLYAAMTNDVGVGELFTVLHTCGIDLAMTSAVVAHRDKRWGLLARAPNVGAIDDVHDCLRRVRSSTKTVSDKIIISKDSAFSIPVAGTFVCGSPGWVREVVARYDERILPETNLEMRHVLSKSGSSPIRVAGQYGDIYYVVWPETDSEYEYWNAEFRGPEHLMSPVRQLIVQSFDNLRPVVRETFDFWLPQPTTVVSGATLSATLRISKEESAIFDDIIIDIITKSFHRRAVDALTDESYLFDLHHAP